MLAWVTAVLVWLAATASVQGQALDAPKPFAYYTSLDQEAYDRVLDLIFPVPPKIANGVIFTMSVRILPASEPGEA
jgi:hypothetical protein